MFRGRLVGYTLRISACGAIISLWTTRGASEPAPASDRRACMSAYNSAGELARGGRFRQARESADGCTAAACSPGLRQKCAALSIEMEAQTPSVVPLVIDEAGEPRVDVRVTMDGELLTSRLDGRSVLVDPGLHKFSFSLDERATVTRDILVGQGQRNRPISVSLRASDRRAKTAELPATKPLDVKAGPGEAVPEKTQPTALRPVATSPATESPATDSVAAGPSEGRTPRSAVPYLLGAAGVAGIGGFGVLTYWGGNDNQSLARCSPYCSPASVDRVRKLYTAANISLGVGIAAIGAAAVSWFLLSPEPPKADHAAYVLDVKPVRSGVVAGVSGSF